MVLENSKTWLLLIHHIPPKLNALRVKIWRRLQQVGAVAIKQSVYAMPLFEHSREDLSWILKEIIEGGGDGSISEARFVEGLSDEQVIDLFQSARKLEYKAIIQDANLLLAEWSSGQNDLQDPVVKSHTQVLKLQRRLDYIATIDFFEVPERGTAEILLKELESLLSGQKTTDTNAEKGLHNLEGKTWVTRENLFVDRMACGWLIRRLVDEDAVFKFVSDHQYFKRENEIRFDMVDGEFSHVGDQCTFEVMAQCLRPHDRALVPLAEVVHDINLKDAKYGRAETDGFNALLAGLIASQPDDAQRMVAGFQLFENLYVYFQRHKWK